MSEAGERRRPSYYAYTEHIPNPFGISTLAISRLPEELISQVTLELDGFLEVIGMWSKHGWSWGCV
jgi:hypothetical protein